MNLRRLQKAIQERQVELHRIAGLLGVAAHREGLRAGTAKVLVIVMGAFVATQAVAAKIWGDNNAIIIVVYTNSGLMIAAVSGLEAAFKSESRSTGLKSLANRCQTTIFQIDTRWQKSVGWFEELSNDPKIEESRLKAAQELLDLQDQALTDVSSKATELGMNITNEVRELYNDDPPAMA